MAIAFPTRRTQEVRLATGNKNFMYLKHIDVF
jgi:hypothetical protein